MTNSEQPARSHAAPIRIGLVDDQPLVRAGFAMLLGSQEDLDVAWQASDGDEVLDLARAQPADIVLMDVQMARVNGIAATERLLPEFPDTQVIMLTTFDDQNFVHGAISAGASGFLLKDVEPEDLLAAIRTVHSARPSFHRALPPRCCSNCAASSPRHSLIHMPPPLRQRLPPLRQKISRHAS